MKRHPKIAVTAPERPVARGQHSSQLELESWNAQPPQRKQPASENPDLSDLTTEMPEAEHAVQAVRQLKAPGFAIQSNAVEHAAFSQAGTKVQPQSEIDLVLERMGTAMGQDFSSVEVKVNSPRATELDALAFCEGETLYFAPGQFSPDTTVGLQLIGHELAHVVQQRAGRVEATTQLHGVAVNTDRELEREADALGELAATTYRQMHGQPMMTRAAETHPLQGKVVAQLQTVAQLDGEYAGFSEALAGILAPTTATPGAGSPGYPGTYDGRIPENGLSVLWDLFKTLHWEPSFGRTAQAWAEATRQHSNDLAPELTAGGAIAASILRRIATAIAPILNPASGSTEGSNLESVFASSIDAHISDAVRSSRDARTARTQEAFALELRETMIAAAHILSASLHPDVPAVILDANSKYNYLHYQHAPGASHHAAELEKLFEARWEVRDANTRTRKLNFVRDRWRRPLLGDTVLRTMFQALTTMDAAAIDAEINALRAAIQTYVLDRMEAIKAEPVPAPIARNGLAIPAATARRPRRRSGEPAAPITFEDDLPTNAWLPVDGYTSDQALVDLNSTEHHMSLMGANIGAFDSRGGGFPVVYGGREYLIVTRTGDRNFFGVKFGGDGGLMETDFVSLLDDPICNFSEAQKAVLRSILPQINSEGPISSVNTYDRQLITLAGCGEKSGNITPLIDGARLYNPALGDQLNQLQTLVSEFVRPSPQGTAGPARDTGKPGIRLDLELIDQLVTKLLQPDLHRALTYGKMNNVVIGFFGMEAYGAHHTLRRRDRDVRQADEERLNREMSTNHLHPVIMGVAYHNHLGAPGLFDDTIGFAIRANNLYPQRSQYISEGVPDFENLSRQLAYLGKIRFMRAAGSDHIANIGSSNYATILSQKVVDFNNYFKDAGTPTQDGAPATRDSNYFVMSAATEVLPFWTGLRQFTKSSTPLGADRIILRSGRDQYDAGPVVEGITASTVVPDEMENESE